MPADSPSRRSIAAATLTGALLRGASLYANLGFPHGDVHLDAATARSLAGGLGFRTPWEEGTSVLPDPIGPAFGHPADQHGPLWPLLGAPLTHLAGDSVLALQILSWIAGVVAIPVAARLFASFAGGAGSLAAWAIALSLPLCDYSGNGSLYSAQVLGVLLLPLAARDLARPRDAILSGAILGLLFLLNYQCAPLAPAFAAAAAIGLGWRASAKPIALAAASCIAVTLPWFVRNAVAFGSPFFTTNFDYVIRHLGLHTIDVSGERPLVVSSATLGDVVAGVARWAPKNFAYLLTTIHLACPLLPLFALGGFERMVARRRVGGWILALSFLALLAASGLWPTPKARYLVPLVAIASGAACVELALGARASFALAASAVTLLLGVAIRAWNPADGGFPWVEGRLLIPTLLVPFAALSPRGRRLLPLFALALLALHGAFRVLISLDRPILARLSGASPIVDASQPPPTATFYDLLGAPFTESYERAELRDLEAAGRALHAAGARRIIAPVEIAASWNGELVSMPWYAHRFDLEVLPKTQTAFKADGLVLRRGMLRMEGTLRWLLTVRARQVYEGGDSVAFVLGTP